MIGIGFGAYFGILFFAKRNKLTGTPIVKGEAWWKPVLRTLITLLLVGIVLLPFFLLTVETISNIYVLMIFKTLLPTFAAGFLLFCGALEYIFVHMKILEIEEQYYDPLLDPVLPDRQNVNGSEDVYDSTIVNRLSLLERHASKPQRHRSGDVDQFQ